MSQNQWSTAVQGFLLGAGLIIAIGAQNAFVLRQGLLRSHVGVAVLCCTLCDSLLIGCGLAGVGTLLADRPRFIAGATWLGIAYLLYSGLRSFRSACQPSTLDAGSQIEMTTTRATIGSAIGFSLLNPHAYIDTCLVLGGIGGRYPVSERVWFGLGAVLASAAWFSLLAVAAARLSPLFRNPRTWRILDLVIGFIMCGLAASLCRDLA